MYVRRYLGWCAVLLGMAMLAACAGGSGSSGFDTFPRSENAAIQQALAEDHCVQHESLTICPAQETQGSPAASPTAAAAVTPTGTSIAAAGTPTTTVPNASPTAAPTGTPPISGPAVILSAVSGAPGSEVEVTAALSTDGALVSGVQNDIGFDPVKVSIVSTPEGLPDCRVNPAIHKDATTFTFLPEGCDGVGCTSVQARVFSPDNVDVIPDGSVLYVCTLSIAPDAFGRIPLPATDVLVSAPAAGPELGIGVDGAVLIQPQPTPTSFAATPTRVPTTGASTATATPTSTPLTPLTPAIDIGLTPGVPITCLPVGSGLCEFAVPFTARAFAQSAVFRVAVRQVNPLGSWTIDGEPVLIGEADQQTDYEAPVALAVEDASRFSGTVQIAVLAFVTHPPALPTPSGPGDQREISDLTGTGADFGFVTGELSIQSASPVP